MSPGTMCISWYPGIYRYFLLHTLVYRYFLLHTLVSFRYLLVLISIPVSLGTMFFGTLDSFYVLLVALPTPWYLLVHLYCVTSEYLCISVF